MLIVLNLNNFENEHVATGLLQFEYEDDCRYAEPEIRQIFSDKILEYNWQEDQSDLTAIYILRDAMVEISEGLFSYADVQIIKDDPDLNINDKAMKFIRNNIMKGTSFASEENSSARICFTPVFATINDVICITMAKEDGEEVR